jgi:hypothetical protein
MPLTRIIPANADDPTGEYRVETVELPGIVLNDEERTARVRADQDMARYGERYADLNARPHPEEAIPMNEETRRRLQDEIDQKRAVPNVVTTHSDVAKVAGGNSGVELVPTHSVYTQEDPTGAGMQVEDRTVTLHGVGYGETVLDRAESSLSQPVGDEYSARSATGPTLAEGVVLKSIAEGETTEAAHDVDQTPAERSEQSAENARTAVAEAAKVEEKEAEDLKAALPSTAPSPSEDTSPASPLEEQRRPVRGRPKGSAAKATKSGKAK